MPLAYKQFNGDIPSVLDPMQFNIFIWTNMAPIKPDAYFNPFQSGLCVCMSKPQYQKLRIQNMDAFWIMDG